MDIPKRLDEWVVAFTKITDSKYDFFMRGLGVNKINIEAVKEKMTGNYHGEIRIGIKDSVQASMSIPQSSSERMDDAILKSLEIFVENSTNGG